MNKVFHINLGGYPFTIDEDAYQHLRSYLDTIHRHFRSTEGYEEITHDIEARLAELFMEQLGNRPIVTIQEVEDAINIMGRPEDFGAEPMEENPFTSEAPEGESAEAGTGKKGFKIKTGKRLFRDPEEQVVGGVCAGLAAYFGIPDPIWVRLFFVLVVISGGVGIPIYLLLWAIMPEAKTASDRYPLPPAAPRWSNRSRPRRAAKTA
ncbi:MAG: PspC domain-containing protein, partial [Bacteroidetes bacterium]